VERQSRAASVRHPVHGLPHPHSAANPRDLAAQAECTRSHAVLFHNEEKLFVLPPSTILLGGGDCARCVIGRLRRNSEDFQNHLRMTVSEMDALFFA
jgi:hypothetical protein